MPDENLDARRREINALVALLVLVILGGILHTAALYANRPAASLTLASSGQIAQP